MSNNIKQKKKVAVAMSGGVDSSVAAALLKEQGYDVTGVFMQFWFPSGEKYGENRCCSLESWQEAQKVAKILGIPIYKVNFGKKFKQVIVDDFLSQYRSGKTPNPCIACNKFIKFDLLLKYAQTVFGDDYLATGHYARLRREFPISNFQFPKKILNSKNKKQNNNYQLYKSKDLRKDQTYFLYNLTQKQLKHLLFPLGDYQKDEVRLLAKKMKLPVHAKPDSQEICFVGNSHYDFLKKYLKPKPGNIIESNTREVIGRHQGLPFYTMGQRSGIGLSGGPWYVCGFNKEKNILEVTTDQRHSDIYSRELYCQDVNWLGSTPKFPFSCQAQIRYHAKQVDCRIIKKSVRRFQVVFAKPQRAAMAGQSIVFYHGDLLLGGGVII